jgi:hypothetical protein
MIDTVQLPQQVNLPGFIAFEPAWAEFGRRHSQWLAERLAESDVVYRVPQVVLDLLWTNLNLDAVNLAAEEAFDKLCLASKAVGVWSNRPIGYRWLLPATPTPFAKSQLESLTALGWTREQVKKVPGLLPLMDDVSKRLQSVAGRRICNPEFLAERDQLRNAWNSLADGERPMLPLSRTRQLPAIPGGLEVIDVKGESKALADFLIGFGEFCERWSLLGMATWDLPELGGLNWPELASTPQSSHARAVTFRSPVDFPVLDSDGLGAIARDQHVAAAKKVGVEDLKRWETYARLFEIDHWERVLRTRYAEGARPRDYVTFLEASIGKIIHRDVERVHKLRKQLRGLKSGRRNRLSSAR